VRKSPRSSAPGTVPRIIALSTQVQWLCEEAEVNEKKSQRLGDLRRAGWVQNPARRRCNAVSPNKFVLVAAQTSAVRFPSRHSCVVW
jgi:hypothetical protein